MAHMAGIREMLYLFAESTMRGIPTETAMATAKYNPHRDTWEGSAGFAGKVRDEGSASLERLAHAGISRADAMRWVELNLEGS